MRIINANTTNQSIYIRVVDNPAGTPEISLTSLTPTLAFYYLRDQDELVEIPLVDLTAIDDSHVDGGFIHVLEGLYRLDLPDAALESGVNGVLITGYCAFMLVLPELITLEEPPIGPSGIGISAKIGSIIKSDLVYDIVQGEDRTISIFAEGSPTFANISPTAITVVFEDSDGTQVTIANSDITRILEDSKYQVIRFLLEATDSDDLDPGYITIEVSFDDEKAQIKNAVRIVEGL